MFDSPDPLGEETIIDGFTPDATLSWLVAYAGPCGDPECDKDHSRVYMIPMIGWLHAVQPKTVEGGVEEIRLRPAIMSSGGSVVDFMNVGKVFRFIAIVRATDDAVMTAKGIFAEKFGTTHELIIEQKDAAPVN